MSSETYTGHINWAGAANQLETMALELAENCKVPHSAVQISTQWVGADRNLRLEWVVRITHRGDLTEAFGNTPMEACTEAQNIQLKYPSMLSLLETAADEKLCECGAFCLSGEYECAECEIALRDRHAEKDSERDF